ncbi:hypothetical protein [Spirosoma sp.]|uniref:hypothetical protein n=1 Tax=Spirosoma sp. TaxID=1899569 RepID=UPI00261D9910|nr:hypothetical protein [Spirosoma sp.]MCX6219151.1 hypothetical protein [Spirosoma sp.]
MLFGSATTYAQKDITIQLSIISRELLATTGQEAGLLLDVKNQTPQDVALFTPSGDLIPYVRYYKLNTLTNRYTEIKHPLYEEIKKESALQDSLFKATGAVFDFFGRENYNSKSGLYRQFVRDDSLWYDHQYSTSQYAQRISETDMQHVRQVTGPNTEAVSFTLIKGGEHYQDFCAISFLYQQRGDYKIVVELPPLDLQGVTYQLGTFRVKEPGSVSANELYLHVP